jgi:hypothetical protein
MMLQVTQRILSFTGDEGVEGQPQLCQNAAAIAG